MSGRALLTTACLLCLVAPGDQAAAAPRFKSPNKSPNLPIIAAIQRSPLSFYLATGEPDACGPGCSEWIAAEGSFDPGASQRFQAFLKRVSPRRPPVYFQSPGGLQPQGLAIGRLMRARGMTAGVGRTVPQGCVIDPNAGKDDTFGNPCQALKRLGRPVPSELNSLAACNSACVYALFGAKIRQVPPGSRLGVHSGKVVRLFSDGRIEVAGRDTAVAGDKRLSTLRTQLRSYIREMGIDLAVLDVIDKVPFERVHWLSRNEIAKYGIDTREFQETRWTAMTTPSQPPSVMKILLEAKGADRTDFRTSFVQLACAGPRAVRIAYFRGLGPNEGATTRTVRFDSDGRRAALPARGVIVKSDLFEAGATFEARVSSEAVDFFEAAGAGDSIFLIEIDGRGLPGLTRLSTSGLSQAIGVLRRQCESPPS